LHWGAIGHAARRVGVEGGFTLGGGAVGYAATGTMDGALMGASMGQAIGGAFGNFAVACFTAGTPLVVDREGNSRPIDEIEVGDFVLARSEFDPDGPLELKRVEEKFVRTAVVMELVVHGQSIKTTAEHPIYVPAQGKFVVAGELQVGEQLVGHDGKLVQIESIGSTGEVTTVYNLRVADFHTYFVGGTIWGWDAWVHNANYGFKSLKLKQQIEYLRDKGISGADQLLANLSSASRNVRQGARFQAKRAVNYYLAGKLDSIEQAINGGRVDIVLKTTMQVESKSWWSAESIGQNRLRALERQIDRYLFSAGNKLRVEFEHPIADNVRELLTRLQRESYGTRLQWKQT
jgi:hypothetical protein